MGLCQPVRCGCGIKSSTLTVKGSGNEGDPFVIDGTNPPVYTEATLPGAGVRFVGMVVSTTDTFRLLRWTGTVWTVLSEPPQPWTPTLTQGVLVPTHRAAADPGSNWYQRSNGVCHAEAYIVTDGSGTANQLALGSLPVQFIQMQGTWAINGGNPGWAPRQNLAGSVIGQAPNNVSFTADNYPSYLGINPTGQAVAGQEWRWSVWGWMT